MTRRSKIQRGKQVLGFIKSYIAINDEAPTIAEIGEFLNFSSPASVHAILAAMENQGTIKRTRQWRGIIIIA